MVGALGMRSLQSGQGSRGAAGGVGGGGRWAGRWGTAHALRQAHHERGLPSGCAGHPSPAADAAVSPSRGEAGALRRPQGEQGRGSPALLGVFSGGCASGVATGTLTSLMKKQYFADKRDYLKYSILRHLLVQGMSITVCWMMTPDDSTGQGAQKRYLGNPKRWRSFDPNVFDFLKAQVDSGIADIRSMESGGPISRCRFYWERLRTSAVSRKGFLDSCLRMASGTDLVFFDPDIGPEPEIMSQDMDKYILWDEIERTYHRGHSVMVFSFLRGGMSNKNRLVTKRRGLLQLRLPEAEVAVLRSHDLAFYCAVHSAHTTAFDRAIWSIMDGWKKVLVEEPRP